MTKIVIGIIMSLAINALFAVRNYYGKNKQIFFTWAAYLICLLEYIFIFFSPAFIVLISFNLIYMTAYQFRARLLRLCKVDITFVLMIALFAATIVLSITFYDGPASISGIVILFLEIFAVFMCTAQGMRYKNGMVSVLYIIMDVGAGNYFAVVMDTVNMIVPITTIIKNKGEKLFDREMITENVELVKVSREARKYKKDKEIDD